LIDEKLIERLRRQPTCRCKDAAALLGISRGSVFKAANAGEIEAIRIGHRLLCLTKPLLERVGITSALETPAACSTP
jgi:excisionase family DNA binding protein